MKEENCKAGGAWQTAGVLGKYDGAIAGFGDVQSALAVNGYG
jgi:hypothetical protein